MKHPYEAFGSIATGACLVFVLGFGIGDYVLQEADKPTSSSPSGGSTLEKYVPWVSKPVYNNYDDYYNSCPDAVVDPEGQMECIRVGEMQECKKASKDMQEFYDCVNRPEHSFTQPYGE